MNTIFETPQGKFTLHRLPQRKRELLQAWDAADESLIDHISSLPQLQNNPAILIINDGFGALTAALHHHHPAAVSDSFLSQEATRINLGLNALSSEQITLTSSMEYPQGYFDLVLIKVPKTLALLEDGLIRLRPLIDANTQVIVAGMVKAMPANVWKLIERIIGPTTTSLAKKKARLIFATLDPSLPTPVSPYPTCYTLEDSQHQICNHANLFSRESLDIGTRLFLQHIPTLANAHEIIDLGCGNGVVGLIAAERNPAATIHFVDESHMAVASARQNFQHAFGMERPALFHLGDSLSRFNTGSADLVLCNPPFHQQNSVGDHLAQRMFDDSKRVLKSGGELWIVGNRHLGYHKSLKKIFGNATLVDSNAKFVILRATRV